MATVKPFRAIRPIIEKVSSVASAPYDVMNVAEAKNMVSGNDLSFLHVSRAEVDLPDSIDVHSTEVYQKAKENLACLQAEGILIQEDSESLYAYRLTMGEQTQVGIVGCCAVDEYDNDTIKKHEKTRPEKEDDRTAHMITLRAQTGLIFLCYRGTSKIDSIVNETIQTAPLYDFVAPDGIRHEAWRVEKSDELSKSFKEVPCLYVADGHHRAASSSRARRALREENPDHNGSEDYNYFLCAVFPAEQLKILPYNRIVKDLNGLTDDEFLEKVRENFVITETDNPNPEEPNNFCMYLSGKWRRLHFSVNFYRKPDVIDGLDVSILQNYLLEPILGIKDVRTDKRIDFVGGIRGTKELERLVDEGKSQVAFSMFATTLDDLLNVSDEGEVMPPKSTWFEPKLRDGLFVHKI